MKNFILLLFAGLTAAQPAMPASATGIHYVRYSKSDSVLPVVQHAIPLASPAAAAPHGKRTQQYRKDTLAPKDLLRQQDSLDLLRHLKVHYKPLRLAADFKPFMTIGMDREKRLVRNFLNIGMAYYYSFPQVPGQPNGNFGYLYGSVYLPVNRLLSKYSRQDKGLFIFGHGGYGVTDIKIQNTGGKPKVLVTGGFVWRAGMDYFFCRGLGITVSTIAGKTWLGGLAFVL